MTLPFNELRFNIAFCAFIMLYWISWLWKFFAYVPGADDDDEQMFKFKPSDLNFWFITSLILFIVWIFQLKYPILVFLTLTETIVVTILYFNLIITKQRDIRKHNKKLVRINKEKIAEIKDRLS